MAEITNAELREFHEKREVRDRLKAQADLAEKEYREIEALVWDKMDDNGDNHIDRTLPGIGTVRVDKRSTLYSRVLDTDTLLDSLENEGRLDEYTKPGFEKRRLNELVRELLETGGSLPEGLDFYEKRYLRYSHKGE